MKRALGPGLLWAMGVLALLFPYILYFVVVLPFPEDKILYCFCVLFGYSILAIWSVLVIALPTLATAASVAQGCVAFAVTAISTPAVGRTVPSTMGIPEFPLVLGCHVVTLAVLVLPLLTKLIRRKAKVPAADGQ